MNLEVFFDYTCPFCYLGLSEVRTALKKHPDIEVAWRPCEAHPRPEPRQPGWTDRPDFIEALLPRFEAAGLTIRGPYAPGNYNNLVVQGMLYLEAQGIALTRYHDAIYNAVFVQSADVEDLDVLCACAAAAGGDKDGFRKALEDGTYEAAQLDLNRYAWEENALEAVPSLRFGDKRLKAKYLVGLVPAEIEAFLTQCEA